MQKITLILTLILSSTMIFAQDSNRAKANQELQTLMGKHAKLGGYIGFSMSTSDQLDDAVFLKAGGFAAAVFNHRLALGLGGFGYSSDLSNVVPDSSTFIEGGYGGLLIEPILFPEKPIHFSIPILIGAGSNSFSDEVFGNYRNYGRSYENYLFIEPAINVELSLTKFLRFGINARYMITSPIQKTKHSESLQGLNFGFNLKLGWF